MVAFHFRDCPHLGFAKVVSRPLIVLGLFVALGACKSNPNKAVELNTEIEKTTLVSNDERVGVNEDEEMVYQRKVLLAEDIRKLQNSVVETEDRVYGTRAYGTTGLLGAYRRCYQQLMPDRREQFPAPEGPDRMSEREEDVKIGIDTKSDKLHAVSEEKLVDRLTRLREYRKTLQTREDGMSEGIERCRLLVQ